MHGLGRGGPRVPGRPHRPGRRQLGAALEGLADAAPDVGDVQRVDEHHRVAADLGRRGAPARHDRRAVGHGLEDGQAEALAQAGVADRVGALVERGLRRLVDEPQPSLSRPGCLVAPPLRPDHDHLLLEVERAVGLQQAGQVLAGLEGADEQQVRAIGEAEPAPHGVHGRGRRSLDRVEAQRDEPELRGVEPGGDGVVERRSRRAQHQVGVLADASERRGEGVDAVAGERPGIVAEGQVVHGHDERRRLPGRDEDRGGVDDVDRTGRPLDRWPAEAAPGLVEGSAAGAGASARAPAARRAPAAGGGATRRRRRAPPRAVRRARGPSRARRRPCRRARRASTAPGCRPRAPAHAGPPTARNMVVMSDFWSGRRVLVTGGSGFLGRVVVRRLHESGADVVAPRQAEFDLTDPGQADAAVAGARADLVIHLAARVGGIGYNQAEPATLYTANLLMGTYVIEAARRHDVDKTVLVGTVVLLPQVHPGPVRRALAVGRLPGGDQRAVRHRQEGAPDPRPGQRRAVRAALRLPHPDEPLRSGRQVPPQRLPRHPRAHQEVRRRGRGRARQGRGLGHGPGQPRVPLRRRRGRGDHPRGRARRGHGAHQPRHRPRDHDPRDRRAHRRAGRLRGRPGLGSDAARRPAPPPRGRLPGGAGAGLAGPDALRRGPAAHHRVVPRPPRRGQPRPQLRTQRARAEKAKPSSTKRSAAGRGLVGDGADRRGGRGRREGRRAGSSSASRPEPAAAPSRRRSSTAGATVVDSAGAGG